MSKSLSALNATVGLLYQYIQLYMMHESRGNYVTCTELLRSLADLFSKRLPHVQHFLASSALVLNLLSHGAVV